TAVLLGFWFRPSILRGAVRVQVDFPSLFSFNEQPWRGTSEDEIRDVLALQSSMRIAVILRSLLIVLQKEFPKGEPFSIALKLLCSTSNVVAAHHDPVISTVARKDTKPRCIIHRQDSYELR
ncbi:hypothetical protein AABB24_039731, partial [Solanum stoloniferum]